MREILFRGKRKDTGKMVYGFLIMNACSKAENGRLICYTRPEIIPVGEIGEADYDGDGNYYEYTVLPETVGQYTGLTDKNGKKIFEGDIVICRQEINGNFIDTHIEKGYVEMKHGAFGLHRKQGYYRPFKDWLEHYSYEVIGNIHDNPELLKGGEG